MSGFPKTLDSSIAVGDAVARIEQVVGVTNSTDPASLTWQVTKVQTLVGDSDYQILPTDRYVCTSATFTAGRTWPLPPAASVKAGWEIRIADVFGGIVLNGLYTPITVAAGGTDLIKGGNAGGSFTFGSFQLNYPFAHVTVRSDGVSTWSIVDADPTTPTEGNNSSDGEFQNLAVDGLFYLTQGSSLSSVSNGANADYFVVGSYLNITGPTGAFSFSGFTTQLTPPVARKANPKYLGGNLLIVENQTAFTMTLNHENAGSQAANRIHCPAGADIVVAAHSTAHLIYRYDATQAAGRWGVIAVYP